MKNILITIIIMIVFIAVTTLWSKVVDMMPTWVLYPVSTISLVALFIVFYTQVKQQDSGK